MTFEYTHSWLKVEWDHLLWCLGGNHQNNMRKGGAPREGREKGFLNASINTLSCTRYIMVL